MYTKCDTLGVELVSVVRRNNLNDRLRSLGFTVGTRMKLYGEEFEVAGEPIIVDEKTVMVDAIKTKSGERKRVRVPLPILKIAGERAA
jgi:hypothetical protein